MRIGIIGAMEEEIRLIKANLSKLKEITHHQVTFYQGYLENREVILVQSGIGKVNATITTVLLVQQFNVDLIINTGTAGGLHKGLKVGDIVIADSLTYHDVDVTGFGYEKGQMAGMPALYYPDLQYSQLAKGVCRQLEIEPIFGQIVSGDQFVNSHEKVAQIAIDFPKAKACEMESTAIAQTAHVMKVPFVIIRAISDAGDDDAAFSFDEFVVVAGKASAQIVMNLVINIE